jgi:hypothetical protein
MIESSGNAGARTTKLKHRVASRAFGCFLPADKAERLVMIVQSLTVPQAKRLRKLIRAMRKGTRWQ